LGIARVLVPSRNNAPDAPNAADEVSTPDAADSPDALSTANAPTLPAATTLTQAVARRWPPRLGGSLQLRVVAITFVLSVIAMMLVGGYLSSAVRDGLFSDRRDQILAETARGFESMQTSLDSATATTAAETQQLVWDLMRGLRISGGADRDVMLLRNPKATAGVPIIDYTSRPGRTDLITDELREDVSTESGQFWQSIQVPPRNGATGDPVPGMIVGSQLDIPIAGSYELYIVESLENEQNTLDLVQRVLLAGGVVLIGALMIIAWFSARQVVRPVQNASAIAARLAAGQLTERMTEKGAHELAQLARSFNGMAMSLQEQISQLEELSHLQRRFVSDVSHELRTPLTTIRMAAEVMYASRDSFPPALARSAELLSTQLDRFEALLADLLEISRFDAGAAELDAENADVTVLMQRVTDLMEPLAESKGTHLRIEKPREPIRADIDVRRVERILRNLISNAIEHAEDQPIDVFLAADENAVAVVVQDHGVGMTAEESAHVFDRFWRADPARARTTGGTGLGLSISIEDANLHGGWLNAWGREGEGSSFRLTLPRRAGRSFEVSPLPLAPETEQEDDGVPERTDPAAVPRLAEGWLEVGDDEKI